MVIPDPLNLVTCIHKPEIVTLLLSISGCASTLSASAALLALYFTNKQSSYQNIHTSSGKRVHRSHNMTQQNNNTILEVIIQFNSLLYSNGKQH